MGALPRKEFNASPINVSEEPLMQNVIPIFTIFKKLVQMVKFYKELPKIKVAFLFIVLNFPATRTFGNF